MKTNNNNNNDDDDDDDDDDNKYFILRQLRRKWLSIPPSQRLMFNRSTAQILA